VILVLGDPVDSRGKLGNAVMITANQSSGQAGVVITHDGANGRQAISLISTVTKDGSGTLSLTAKDASGKLLWSAP